MIVLKKTINRSSQNLAWNFHIGVTNVEPSCFLVQTIEYKTQVCIEYWGVVVSFSVIEEFVLFYDNGWLERSKVGVFDE